MDARIFLSLLFFVSQPSFHDLTCQNHLSYFPETFTMKAASGLPGNGPLNHHWYISICLSVLLHDSLDAKWLRFQRLWIVRQSGLVGWAPCQWVLAPPVWRQALSLHYQSTHFPLDETRINILSLPWVAY